MDSVPGLDKLLISIAQLSVRVTKVSQDVRDAQADMEDLSERLISLEDCIETLSHDFQNPAVYSPDRQKKHLIKMTDDRNRITVEMLALLRTLMSVHDANDSPWTNTNIPKIPMVKLRHMLEADRSAIAMVLGMKQARPTGENRTCKIGKYCFAAACHWSWKYSGIHQTDCNRTPD
jgi:hypothetical protein